MPKGIFGQTTFDPATGAQREMFDTSRQTPASPPIKGSKSALDPRHTGKLFDKGSKMTAEGHWITKFGNHILIKDPIGGGKGFSRAELHRKIIAHHESVQGKGSYTAHDEKLLYDAAGAGNAFTFYKQLPAEIKAFQAGRPELRSLFKVTQEAAQAGGADAFGELGDKYLDIAEAKAGSPLRHALNTARGSNDPEVRFMAAIHDHLPPASERAAQGTIDVSKLRVGQSFKIQGDEFHVLEDADGFKVLSGPSDYPEVPVEALKKIPIDRGSLRAAKASKMKHDDVAPFSVTAPAYYLHAAADLTDAVTLGQGLPTQILGQPVRYFWADGIRCGKYTHPTKGFTLDVDRKQMDTWVLAHKRMREAGVDVPAVADHSEKARDALGNVIDIKREGDVLRVLHQLVGEDAHRMAARNKVSLGISPNFRDGKGVVYGSAVVHSALTPVPVVPGQAGFVAASRGQTADQNEVDVLCLTTGSSKGERPMKAETLQKIRELPGAAEVPEDGAAEFLLSYATTAAENVTTLKTRAEAAEAKVLTLSRESAVEETPGPREMYYLSKTLDVARNEATKVVGPHVVTEAQKRFLGQEIFNTSIFTMSRTAADGDAKLAAGMDKAIEFFELMKLATPPVRRTPANIEFARPTPTENAADAAGTQDDKAAEEAGLKQGEAYKNEQLKARGLATTAATAAA